MKFSSQIGRRGIQPPWMKQMNQLSLLALTMEHGPILGTGLARLSVLSKPTVSAQGETLIRKRLVAETGTPSRVDARKGVILEAGNIFN